MKIPPKLWQVIIPVASIAAGYFGYEPSQKIFNPPPATAPDVDVEVHLPEQPVVQQSHAHKDWQPRIDAAMNEVITEVRQVKEDLEALIKDNH